MKKKEFIFVLVITFFVFMVWVVAEILHAKPSVPVDNKLQSLLDPINPTFDKQTLDNVANLDDLTSPTNASPSAEDISEDQ